MPEPRAFRIHTCGSRSAGVCFSQIDVIYCLNTSPVPFVLKAKADGCLYRLLSSYPWFLFRFVWFVFWCVWCGVFFSSPLFGYRETLILAGVTEISLICCCWTNCKVTDAEENLFFCGMRYTSWRNSSCSLGPPPKELLVSTTLNEVAFCFFQDLFIKHLVPVFLMGNSRRIIRYYLRMLPVLYHL